MARFQPVLLLLVSVAFVAIGVWMALTADTPADRMTGAACAAFFGACALVFLGQFIKAPPPSPDANGVTRIMPDRAQLATLGLGGILMGAACPFVGIEAWRSGDLFVGVVGWVGGVFFIGCGLVGLWRLARGGPLYRLEREGLINRAAGHKLLPWRAIRGISTLAVKGQKFLALDLDPAFEDPAPLAGTLNRAFGFPGYAITAQGSGLSHEAFEKIIIAYWLRHRGGDAHTAARE